MTNKGLCSNCIYSLWCPTWTEWKCTVKSKRIPALNLVASCSTFKKRDKNFKEEKCQCEDCLKNEDLWEEEDDEIR